jgi:hypothetical protein
MRPLILIVVHCINIRERGQRCDGGLFCRLACEEVGGMFGEDDSDGEVRRFGEGGDDEGEFDCCD